MAYRFERLAEVETMDSVPEGASVLAEVNGAVVRVPSDGMKGSVPDRIKLTISINASTNTPFTLSPAFEKSVLSTLWDDVERWNCFDIRTWASSSGKRREGYATPLHIHYSYEYDDEITCAPYIVLAYMSYDETKLLCSKITLKDTTLHKEMQDETGDWVEVEVPALTFGSATAPVEICSFA